MIAVYVNWREKEILTEEEYEKKVNARVEDILNDEERYEEWKEEYLESNYKASEIFDLTEEEKKEILADIKSDILDWVTDDMGYSYDEVNLDI